MNIQSEDESLFYLNTYEIPFDTKFINEKKNIEIINSFLFECQCALFLFDSTSKESFDLIKKLVDLINFEKFPYTKPILVQNKIDMGNSSDITESEISEILNENKSFEAIKISIKEKTGINDLIKKIDTALNKSSNELPINIVFESIDTTQNLVNRSGILSFILIGDSTVGKTCFFNRYFKNKFSMPFLATIGIEKDSKLIEIREEIYKITLWDTAGQERFKCLPRRYYQNADGIFLLYDVTKEETFNNVTNWIKDIKDNSNRTVGENSKQSITIFLLGNKVDSPQRVITSEQGEKLAGSLGMKYYEISCKLNLNIAEVMSRMIMDTYKKMNNIDNCFQLTNKKHKKKSEKKCC